MKRLAETWRLLGRSIYVGERLDANLKAITLAAIATVVIGLILIPVNLAPLHLTRLIASANAFAAGAACAYFAGVRKNRKIAVLIPVVFCFAVFTFYALAGVSDGVAVLFSLIVPMGMCYYISVRYGIIFSAYYTLLFGVMFYSPLREHFAVYYSEAFMVRFPLIYACVSAFSVIAMVQYHKSALREMDYTEELKKQKLLADRANMAKSSFLASMSHEIRTPINAVLGMDEMILRESREDQILSYAGDIQNAGRTLLSLINDILDLSKIEAGRMEILPVQYDLGSVVNDLVGMIRGRAEGKGLRLTVEVDETTPHLLLSDEIRIRQCALNVLTNAVKYTEKGGVAFSVGYEKLAANRILLRVRVSDTGIGMKPEDMERLFSPFQRIEESRNRSIEGTGLGMNITQQLLAMMGSRLEVESVYGQGSTFTFAVEQPVVEWRPIGSFAGRYEADAPRKAYRESFHAPEAKILVVDDTPVNLTVIRGLLKMTQMRVDTVESGREAVAQAARERYDVIFIDHMMPEMDGIETLHELRKLPALADVPCVALTANAISGAREMYLEAGFTDYLSKPVEGERLEKMLARLLPPEKVLDPSDTPASSAAAEPPAALPDWLKSVDALDTRAGLRHCGTEEIYLETLGIYARSAPQAADEIEGFYRAGSIADATVKIHALKSTSRAIGAEALGALAEKLELAGKAGDTRTLSAGLGELLKRFRALGAALAPLGGGDEPEEDDASLPPLMDAELQEAYGAVRAFAKDYDADGAARILARLRGYRLPPGECKRLKTVQEALEEFDWELVLELLS